MRLFKRSESGYVDLDVSDSVFGTDSSPNLLIKALLNVVGSDLELSNSIEILECFFSNVVGDFIRLTDDRCIEILAGLTWITAADLTLWSPRGGTVPEHLQASAGA